MKNGLMGPLAIIALVVGASGLGLGVYSVIIPGLQGPQGPEGEQGPTGIIQIKQVVNNTSFTHNKSSWYENLSSIHITVSENSSIYATFTATHWLNASVNDVFITVQLWINSTQLSSYHIRHQDTQIICYIRSVGHCEGLISELSAGTYEIWVRGRCGIGNDVITSTLGHPRTLTVMELAG